MSRIASITARVCGPGGVALLLLSACTQDPVEVSLRSLERSGAVAFVCLGDPASGLAPRALGACTAEEAENTADFDQGDQGDDENPGGELPHLYAFVAQTTRGELAVIDLSSDDGNVLDQDGSTPGPNFLPVGAQPTDVVASPGGTAAFVTSAEAGRPAIYAIPTNRIRPCGIDPASCGVAPPTLSSWPVCTLPAAPGDAVLAYDPPDATGASRASCDGAGAAPVGAGGDLGLEGKGRQKLIVALPTMGQLVVLDAQTLLDRPGNDLSPCAIERTIDLQTEVPLGDGKPPYEQGDACVVPETAGPRAEKTFVSTPSSLWYTEGDDRLYVGDLTTPLIHVLDASSACDLRELQPLVATSRQEPHRVVATTKVAASQRLAPGFKRYVYAVDVEDRSLMVFDVSDDTETREPLERPNAQLNPLQPPDRLRFSAAPRDIIVVERDTPETIPASGVATYATRCNPDPSAVACDPGVTTCDPGTLYRTTGDYEEGAGPFTLRGTFAFVALSDGRVSVIDIDDYDADCRAPATPSAFYGCAEEGVATPRKTSDENSCNVVVPHALRSSTFIDSNDLVGRRLPGLTTFPLLYRKDGTVVEEGDPTTPRMRSILPEASYAIPDAPSGLLVVGGETLGIGINSDEPDLVVDAENNEMHTLVISLEEPRAHTSDQAWSITYEGALPGLDGRVGDLQLDVNPPIFEDAAAQFCDRGVQSELAVREQLALVDAPLTEDQVDVLALQLADRLSVTEALPGADDPYWDRAACAFQECLGTFGNEETPREARDIPIREAYGDHLVLATPGVAADEFECCFPTLVRFTVRAGAQWVAVGEATGFLHHVVEDPESGVCRDSCDPRAALLRGRVRTADAAPVPQDSPFAFRNPFFRFAITAPAGTAVPRDHSFRFTTQGQFLSLFASLKDQTDDVLPQTLTYVPATGELAVADGSLEGLMLISTRTMQLERQFF